MDRKTIAIIAVLLVIGIGLSVGIWYQQNLPKKISEKPATNASEKTFKILHIHSYHEEWEWVRDQDKGFNDQLGGLNVEHKAFYMDTKRKSAEADKQEAARQAKELIDTWKPDLVFTTDDNVQVLVARYYVNSSIPFVFSAVNAEPDAYGMRGSTNNCGILEREHSVETINLLRQIVPTIKKIAIITDTDRTMPPIIDRTKIRVANEIPDVQIVSVDIVKTYDEYQQKMKGYDGTADAVIHLGDHTYLDVKNNTNVPFDVAERWAVENSRLPDASFWEDRVSTGGLLAGIAISGYEQGKGAGIMARKILIDGASPQTLGFTQTYKGQPVINLARAKDLGVNITSSLLLSAKIYEKFSWEPK
jgi:ABC-type uncharacterized transport system substrate-binding protein